MRSPGWLRKRGELALALLAAMPATGCNAAFDIHEGEPRPMCTDSMMIDDMEDGDAFICESNGRRGPWYAVGDGTSTDLMPPPPGSPVEFTHALIADGTRGSSRYAARLEGSGFTGWGALIGLSLNRPHAGREPYNASTIGGMKFWMRNNVSVSVDFLVPETVPAVDGGNCVETGTDCTTTSRSRLPRRATNGSSTKSRSWRSLKTRMALRYGIPSSCSASISASATARSSTCGSMTLRSTTARAPAVFPGAMTPL